MDKNPIRIKPIIVIYINFIGYNVRDKNNLSKITAALKLYNIYY